MTLFAKVIGIVLLSSTVGNAQDHQLYKRWKIIADERIFLNLDKSPHGGFRDRIDSVKSDTAFIEFFKDGKFASVDGNGTFKIAGDSVHLQLPDGNSSFHFETNNSSLYLINDDFREDYIRREKLHLVPM